MRKSELKVTSVDFYPALTLIVLLWLIFLLQSLGIFNSCYGVIPWRMQGIKGIVLSPLFHGSWEHLVSNTLPLFVLTSMLFIFYKKQAYTVLFTGWILSGTFLWLLPDTAYIQYNSMSCHIGASGLIYMLAVFLFFSGVFLRRIVLILLSILVAVLYGGLIYGLVPQLTAEGVSWQGHLMGGIVGFLLAYRLNKKKR